MGLITNSKDYLDNWQSLGSLPVLPYGWAGEIQLDLDTENFMWLLRFREISDWIYNNIENYDQNVIWVKMGGIMYAQFRKRRDLVWFKLRWC